MWKAVSHDCDEGTSLLLSDLCALELLFTHFTCSGSVERRVAKLCAANSPILPRVGQARFSHNRPRRNTASSTPGVRCPGTKYRPRGPPRVASLQPFPARQEKSDVNNPNNSSAVLSQAPDKTARLYRDALSEKSGSGVVFPNLRRRKTLSHSRHTGSYIADFAEVPHPLSDRSGVEARGIQRIEPNTVVSQLG